MNLEELNDWAKDKRFEHQGVTGMLVMKVADLEAKNKALISLLDDILKEKDFKDKLQEYYLENEEKERESMYDCISQFYKKD